MMDYNKLAELLFPAITKKPEDWLAAYPKRELPEGAKVTRLGPSPTGFIHLGNLYGAFTDERLAHQSGGIFFLRIEDTDDKREVEGAVEAVITSLDYFGVKFDEGAIGGIAEAGGKSADVGSYGPYYQSDRAEIYQTFAKELIRKGMAYPCFCSEEETAALREQQEAEKVTSSKVGLLKDIKAYLEIHFRDSISLDDLAGLFYIDKYYLTRRFKQQYGCTVNTYLQQLRITHAKHLLRFSDRSIEEIALDCGVNDPNYFARLFKKVEGISPGEFRRSWRSID